ncbi:hypothetical protein MFLAVUS_004646 [Mucor flavus]|uniref:Zinc finger Mcm10/DnaG-type domain-containing protein n=1 Tax=Mucor flavus TaxID=439312 RepID=A0ABP9YWI8_9FUNG
MSDLEDLSELRQEIGKEEMCVIETIEPEANVPEEPVTEAPVPKAPVPKKPVDIDSRSGLRLRRRLFSAKQCDKGLQNVEFVPLNKVSAHTALYNSIHVGIKPTKDWATIGVIDKCYPHSDLCVTRITDMRGAYMNVYITGKAYLKYEQELGMGSVIAIKRPFLLKPTEANHSIALHVDHIQQGWVIGQSLDLIQCVSYTSKDSQCSEWTDIRSGDYCDTHLARVCNYSKNGRMELASGDSGFDIRWATQTKQIDGSYLYESKRETVDPLAKLMSNARSKLKEAYYIKGKGLVAIDGSLIRKKLAQRKETTEAEKDEIQKFLKGRRDPGAEMIRKIKGIKDERPRTVLSKEALDKMGIGSRQLTTEEEESKKRSIEALNKANLDNKNPKKPRYVVL